MKASDVRVMATVRAARGTTPRTPAMRVVIWKVHISSPSWIGTGPP